MKSINNKYLIKGFTFNLTPKLFSFLFSLIVFPIFIKNFGLKTYGEFIYLTSVFTLIEPFLSFGVSDAAGKDLSEKRLNNFNNNIITDWIKFQLGTILIISPILYIIFYFLNNTDLNFKFLLIIYSSTVFSILNLLFKTILNSLLQYKLTSIIDLIESISRNLVFLIVCFYFNSLFFLIFFTTVLNLIILFLLIIAVYYKYYRNVQITEKKSLFKYSKFNESFKFTLLIFSTRTFQFVPIYIIKLFFGSEINGIYGSFNKLLEITTLPSSIIGNLLKYKVKEVLSKTIEYRNKFINLILDIINIFSIYYIIILITLPYASKYFLQKNTVGIKYFEDLSLIILLKSFTDILAPISDYSDQILRRIIFLNITTIIMYFLLKLFSKSFFEFSIILIFIYIIKNIQYFIFFKNGINKNFKISQLPQININFILFNVITLFFMYYLDALRLNIFIFYILLIFTFSRSRNYILKLNNFNI